MVWMVWMGPYAQTKSAPTGETTLVLDLIYMSTCEKILEHILKILNHQAEMHVRTAS